MPKVPYKSNRTECVTLRISPKLRYGLELLCRRQFRSITDVMAFALSEAIKTDGLPLDALWSVDPKERFQRLKEAYPQLLSWGEIQKQEEA